MEKINHIEDLDYIFDNYFLKKTQTNNYVLAESYYKLINTNKLYWIKGESNAYLFEKKDSFYQLYFFINDLEENFNFLITEPIVMEVVYRTSFGKPNEIINYWLKSNFKEHLTRDNLSITSNKVNNIDIKNNAVFLKYADSEEEGLKVKNLFDTNLDKYTGDMLSQEEINTFINNKNIICAYLNNQFCGALQFEIKNNIVWLGHIVTDKKYRGNGIANLLVKKYIDDNIILNTITRYQLWVINDNFAAKSLYDKFGFIGTNKSTTSIIKL